MKEKIEKAIEHYRKVGQEDKPLIIQKLKEWREEDNAINDIAVSFENWWMEVEPIFAEMGLV